MTKMGFIALAFTSLLASLPAHADDGGYCADLPSLAALVKDCQQNSFFVRAADACETKLEADIAVQQAALSLAMAATSAQSASAQLAKIQNNTQNLDQMQSTLQSLETKARQARADMLQYSQNFTYAGPISHAFAAKFHMESFLSHFPCVSNNQKLLKMTVDDVDKHISDLAKAVQGAATLANSSRAKAQTLDASSSSSAVAHGRAPSSATPRGVPQGKSTQGASSITGTEKIQADDHALQNSQP